MAAAANHSHTGHQPPAVEPSSLGVGEGWGGAFTSIALLCERLTGIKVSVRHISSGRTDVCLQLFNLLPFVSPCCGISDASELLVNLLFTVRSSDLFFLRDRLYFDYNFQ